MTIEEKLIELAKINAWLEKGKAQADALRQEIKQEALRLQLIENKEGAASVEFPVNGIAGKLTVTRKINRSLDQKLVPALKKELPPGLFKEKTELVTSAFRNLDARQMGILSVGLKESEGLPVISWEQKKD